MNGHKEMNYGPVQILDFVDNPDPSNTNRILKLDEEQASKIFQEAGERPIALIGIAGPSRKGKSFFLDYVIRYLEALEKDDSDWMDWENKSKPLTGFTWKTSIERETTGIVMWSKPFIMKANGQEVAVLLMDTQGTYDEYTTEKEMTAVVGLSLLSSSCLIFNFFNSLQEDVINSLDTYISYGQLALGDKSGAEDEMEVDNEQDQAIKPFQKLLFLIRDWNMPTEFPYGAKGGRSYLKRKLEVKEGLTPVGRRIRETLNQCFSNLDCFLMPDPGERAKQEGFNGSLEQLSTVFCKRLEELINDLVNPDEIPLKSIFGTEILAVDMVNYLRQYVEVFNGDDIPTPLTLMEATARISNDNLMNLCLRNYLDAMKKKQRGRKFLSDSVLLKAHNTAKEDAMKNFKSTKKMGDKELTRSFEEELLFKIKEAYDKIAYENKTKREKLINDAILSSLRNYKDAMKEEFEDDNNFLEERKLKSLSSSHNSNVSSDLEQKLSDDCDEEEMEEASKELGKKLKEEEEKILLDNSNRKLNAEKLMADKVSKLIDLYQEDLAGKLEDDPYLSDEDLLEYSSDARTDALQRYEKLEKIGSKEFQKHYRKELEQGLEKTFQSLMNSHQVSLNETKENANALMDESIAQIEQDLRKKLNISLEVLMDEDALEEVQMDVMQGAEKEFTEKFKIPPTTKFGEKLVQTLKSKLHTTFQSVVNDVVQERKNCEASWEAAAEEAFEIFKTDLEGFIGKTFHERDVLEDKRDELQPKAIKAFHSIHKVGDHPKPEYFIEKLENKIQDLFEKVLEHNTEREEKAHAEAKNWLHDAHHKFYESEMVKKLDLAKDEDGFREIHEEVKRDAMSKLVENLKDHSPAFVEEYTNQLHKEIQEAFEDELVELFDLKLKERGQGTADALAEARKLYREDMKKHYDNTEFMRPKDLEELHKRVSTYALGECLKKTPLSELQKQDLMAALEETYQSYKEDNDANVPVDPAIGIDLGTTYSCVAVYLKGKVSVIPNPQGKNTTPSYVCYNDKGFVSSVGIPAKATAYDNAENTIFDAKRILGRKFDDPEIQTDMKYWPFKVVNEKDAPKIEINKKLFYPEQISSEVLKEMRVAAEKYLGCTIKNAVITVPAYFTDGQRQATIDAGELAGLKVLNILTEPVSAAVAYKLQHSDDLTKHVLTFDLGGGTFDVAVLKTSKGKIEALAVDGDTHLGGEDFDQNVMKYCALEFQREHGIDLMDGKDSTNDKERQNVRSRLSRLQQKCEEKKIELASCRSVDIAVPGIYNENGSIVDLKVTLTREKFEELNEELFEKTIEIVDKCLRDAKLDKSKITDIVLVGGSTRIPKVQELLADYFEGRPLNKTINPDEAVAYGAAVQAAVLNGQIAQKDKDFNTIQDVSPMSLGVEVYGGGFSVIIPKNTKIPIRFKEQYRTAHNNQTSVQIVVYQGEADIAKNNSLLGEFYLNNIPPAEAQREVIEVTMEINLQGVLHVTAVCTSTGERDAITVTEHKRRMGKEQIRRILDEIPAAAAAP